MFKWARLVFADGFNQVILAPLSCQEDLSVESSFDIKDHLVFYQIGDKSYRTRSSIPTSSQSAKNPIFSSKIRKKMEFIFKKSNNPLLKLLFLKDLQKNKQELNSLAFLRKL
jgi:hypothetical protein